MARTKRTPQHAVLDAGSVTVASSYPLSFYLYLGVKVQYHDDVVEPRELDQILVEQGTNTIPLKTTDPRIKKEDIRSWFLGINQYGVLWRATPTTMIEGQQQQFRPVVWQETVELHDEFYISDQWMMEVMPGGTYHLDNDPQNMPLTSQQFNTIQKIVLQQLQKVTPYSQLWAHTRQQLLDDDSSNNDNDDLLPVPQNLEDAYDCYDRNHHITRLPNWQNQYYPLLELQADPNKDWVTQRELDHGLTLGTGTGSRALIDIYWRALDRQPGGNSDCYTICYTLDCATKTVSTRTAQNWDGTLTRSEYTPLTLSKTIREEGGGGGGLVKPFLDFLKLLRSLGPGDSECTILDTISEDSDEYDTTWSSHEILVFLPKPWNKASYFQFPLSYQQSVFQFLLVNQRRQQQQQFPMSIVETILQFAAPIIHVPVIRLHQRCVFGPQWRSYNDLPDILKVEIPPTIQQQLVLKAAQDLIGMGRVNTWTDAGDGQPPCLASQDEPHPAAPDQIRKDDSSNYQFSCTLHPFYFDFPACNVANKGTSATEWIQESQQQRKRAREEEEEEENIQL